MTAGKISADEGHRRLIAQAETALQAAGVKFERRANDSGQTMLVIRPETGRQASLTGRLARGIRKYRADAELVYDPSRISPYRDGVRAFVEASSGSMKVYMPHDAAQLADPRAPYLVHELIHLKNFGDESRRSTKAFIVKSRALPTRALSLKTRSVRLPGGKAESYSQFMQLDELSTFRHNLKQGYQHTLATLRKPHADLRASIFNLVGEYQQLKVVSERAEAMVTLAKSALAEFERAGKTSLGSQAKYTLDGVTYQAKLVPSDLPNDIGLLIEELPGAFSRQPEVISFGLSFPVAPQWTTSSLQQQLKTLEEAAQQNQIYTNEAEGVLRALLAGGELTDEKKLRAAHLIEAALPKIKQPAARNVP